MPDSQETASRPTSWRDADPPPPEPVKWRDQPQPERFALPSYTPVISSVTPNTVPRSKSPATFTVTGTNLGSVDKILVSSQDGWWSGTASEGLLKDHTDTGFTFTAVPSNIGVYDLYAYDSGIMIAQKLDCVRVTVGGGVDTPTIFSVVPSPNQPNLLTTYTVTGVKLGATDGVYWDGMESGSAAVSNVTETGFTFEATLVAEGWYVVTATAATADLASKANAIQISTTVTPPPITGTLISVTPTEAIVGTPENFTAVGTGLEATDEVSIEGPGGVVVAPTAVQADGTGFTFTATLTAVGAHDVIAFAAGAELGRWSAINAVLTSSAATITDVNPTTASEDTLTSFTAIGTGLAATATVMVEGPGGNEFPATNVLDTGFDFDAEMTDPGTYNVIALDGAGNQITRKDASIAVGLAPLGTIITVTPTTAVDDASTDYAVTGTSLADTTNVLIEGPGGTSTAPTNVVDGGFDFTAILTEPGTYNVIAADANGEIARKDAAVTVGITATIISVTPTQATANVQESFTVLGTALASTTGVTVEGPGGGAFVVANVTATGFTFDAVLTAVGDYNVIATDATGQIARLDAAITVIAAPLATITSVTPPTVDEDVDQLYTVLGTLLSATTSVVVEGPSGVAGGGPFVPSGVTEATFTFTANLTEPGVHNVVAVDSANGEIARLDAAITVADVVAEITSVTPSTTLDDFPTHYDAIGTGLGETVRVLVEGPGGVNAQANNVTPTKFDFDAILTAPGTYNVVALDPGTGEVARLDAAITVSPLVATITAVTPGTTDENLDTLFTVTGTWLATTDGVVVEGPGGVTVLPTGGSVTASGFTFTATLTDEGSYNVIATAAGAELARADAAIQVAPVATITSVNPTMAQDDILTAFAVIGTGLEGTTGVTVEGSGGVQVVPLTVDPLGFGFTFEATLTDIGVYAVIATGAAGEIARRDAAITVGAVIASITSVTPSQSIKNAPESFIVTGTGLATTDAVIVEGLGGVTVVPDLGSVTDTGFTFNATLTEAGDYNVIASAAGSAIARADAAIAVVLATITSVNPTAAQVGDVTTYAVLGTGLTNVDGVTVEGAGGVQVPVLATPVPTDTSFSFEATLTADDVYDVIATITSAEHARLDGAITVLTADVPIITSVTPVVTQINTATTFTAVGEHLELTDDITLDNALTPITGIVPTSVDPTGLGFVFDATIPDAGAYTVIANSLGVEIARWNVVITVTPLGIITDVTPTVSPLGVLTDFTATGVGLLPTDGVRLEGGGETVDGVLVGTPTDTTFDFTAALNFSGDYDVIATTGGNPLAREDNAIFVPSVATILQVTPNAVPHDTLTSYLVEGLSLGAVTTVSLVSIADVVDDQVIVADIPVTPIDDFSFSFDAQLAGADVYSLYAYDATDVEVTNKQGAISVSATTSVITTVDPPQAVVGVPTTFTVTGVDL